MLLEERHEGQWKREFEKLARAPLHGCRDVLRKDQFRAGLRRLACANLGDGRIVTGHPFDQHFALSTGLLAPAQSRMDNPRIVEYEQVAGLQHKR